MMVKSYKPRKCQTLVRKFIILGTFIDKFLSRNRLSFTGQYIVFKTFLRCLLLHIKGCFSGVFRGGYFRNYITSNQKVPLFTMPLILNAFYYFFSLPAWIRSRNGGGFYDHQTPH